MRRRANGRLGPRCYQGGEGVPGRGCTPEKIGAPARRMVTGAARKPSGGPHNLPHTSQPQSETHALGCQEFPAPCTPPHGPPRSLASHRNPSPRGLRFLTGAYRRFVLANDPTTPPHCCVAILKGLRVQNWNWNWNNDCSQRRCHILAEHPRTHAHPRLRSTAARPPTPKLHWVRWSELPPTSSFAPLPSR